MLQGVRVEGLRELERAFKAAGGDLRKELRKELVAVGRPVADDARSRLSAYSSRSAGGIRPRLRGPTTVVVEQRRGRTTGKRPDWGALQMRRALLPALEGNQQNVIERLDEMLDRIGARNGF